MQNGNFYLLKLTDAGLESITGPAVHERMNGCIVVAETPEEARKAAADACSNEGPGIWLDNIRTSCKLIGPWKFGKPKVVLQDRQNG